MKRKTNHEKVRGIETTEMKVGRKKERTFLSNCGVTKSS